MLRKFWALLCISLATACVAQSPSDDSMAESSADDESIHSDDNATISDVAFDEASLAAAADRNQSTSTFDIVQSPSNAVPYCPPDGRVAFSVSGASHVSQGGALLLGYNDKIYTNVGGGWPNVLNGSTFTAQCTGLHFFTVSFVRDSVYNGGSNDDVQITIHKNGTPMGFAWAGESAPYRMTGAYGVTMMLNAGDTVHTTVSSDGGSKRHVSIFNFSGFFVR